MYTWIKFLHIAFFAIWFGGLLALPWIFGEHATQRSRIGISQMRRIERTVFFAVMSPAATLAIVFGMWLMLYGFTGAWLHIKLTLIVFAVMLHVYCGVVMRTFLQGRNRHGRWYFRALCQLPLALLIASVFLAAVKPF